MIGCRRSCSASLTSSSDEERSRSSRIAAVIGWAWRASAQMDEGWRLRSKFVRSALSQRRAASRLQQATAQSPLGKLIQEWPDTVGYLVWPYQCAAWDASERLTRIEGHLAALEKFPGLQLA